MHTQAPCCLWTVKLKCTAKVAKLDYEPGPSSRSRMSFCLEGNSDVNDMIVQQFNLLRAMPTMREGTGLQP